MEKATTGANITTHSVSF